jgi:aspartate 1-decarboxylase
MVRLFTSQEREDLIIIPSYGLIEDQKAKSYQPKLVFADGDNRRVKKIYPRFSHPEGSSGWPRQHISKTG